MKTIKEILQDNNDPFESSNNAHVVSEASLSRLLKKAEGVFAILTAYRGNNTNKENVKLNRNLRGELNSKKLGVIPLVGHWQECQDDTIEYKNCPKDKLIDAVERTYFIQKNDNITEEEFKKVITDLTKKYNQDAAVYKGSDGKFGLIFRNGNFEAVGTKVSVGKIGQAYSQYVKKINTPFVFEGFELAVTNLGRQIAERYGYTNITLSNDEYSASIGFSEL